LGQLLTVAAERNLAQLDEKLYFEVFALRTLASIAPRARAHGLCQQPARGNSPRRTTSRFGGSKVCGALKHVGITANTGTNSHLTPNPQTP
jgi:hypothetical protein